MLDGVVLLNGFWAILMKTWKFRSFDRSGDLRAARVEGMLWIALEKSTTADVSVVMNLTSSHAAFCLSLVLAMPMMVPLRYPLPYVFAWSSGTGNGATP